MGGKKIIMTYAQFLEWFGYLASIIVLISLSMSSIVKLRWLNLLGASLFSTYGFLIHALPVGLLNLTIALIDVYFLFKMYTEKEYLKILEIDSKSLYLQYFLNFYEKDIKKFFPDFIFNPDEDTVIFFVLRNLIPAGLFIGKKKNNTTLYVELDYVIPEYRDLKIGNYIFIENKEYFANKGFSKVIAYSTNEFHDKYLKKMGFKEKLKIENNIYFVRNI